MEPTSHPPDVPHDRHDVRTGAVLQFGFWLLAAAILVHIGIWGFFKLLEAREREADQPLSPAVAASLKRTPPEPRLEPDPLAPLARLRAHEDARLSTYGWVDRRERAVRIPIDRAMELLVERGVPGGTPMSVVTPGAARQQTVRP